MSASLLKTVVVRFMLEEDGNAPVMPGDPEVPCPVGPAEPPKNGLSRFPVPRSKSSSRLQVPCLDPVPEQSSEDSMDSRGRRELQKSMSSMNFRLESLSCQPVVVESDDAPAKKNGVKKSQSEKLKRSFSARILKRFGSLRKKEKKEETTVASETVEMDVVVDEPASEADKPNGKGILVKKRSFKVLKRAVSFNHRAVTRKKPEMGRRRYLDVPPLRKNSYSVENLSLAYTGTPLTIANHRDARTISSDGAGLLEPIASQTKAFSCNSLNSNGNTDESDGPLRISLNNEDEGLSRDPRTVSKHKYFAPNGDRNFITKMITPTFHERSRSFRKLFQQLVPPDEQMLASFSCAYQREILVQGRIFISSRHFCFHANIFGWGTIFVIPMEDVTEITKEKTMGMFPNSIQLATEVRGRFFFASFTHRDKTLKVMHHAWKAIQSSGEPLSPDALWELMNPSPEERERLKERRKEEEREREAEKAQDKPEKPAKPEKKSSKRKKGSASVSSSDEPSGAAMLKTVSAPNLDPSEAAAVQQLQQQRAAAGACSAVLDDTDAERSSSSSTTTDISMAECICDDHGGKKLLDQVFPRSPSELFDLIFTASPWYVQLSSSLKRTAHAKMPLKYTGYSASDWATNKEGVRQRTCTYTMALNHAMAPKTCVVTEKQVYKAFPGGYTIVKETNNAGVPYSDSFNVTCTYCVSSYGRGQARLVVHGGLVFSKSVWGMIRGYIERSTTQGLAEHYDALNGALTEECKRSAGGSDGLALLEDDQNRMDTSSEEGGEAEAGAGGTLRGMAGSISGINFVHNHHVVGAGRMHEEPCFELPWLGRVRRLDFYGCGIMALLALMSLTLIVLVFRLPSGGPAPPQSTADSRLAAAFERYLSPPTDSTAPSPPPQDGSSPDLDSLIAAIGKIGAQLQQVRDAGAANAHGARGDL